MTEAQLTLRKSLTRHLRAGHPWVYRDAVEEACGQAGDVITLVDRQGSFVARGLLEAGPIAVRVLTVVDEPIGRAFFARRIRKAFELRAFLDFGDTTAYRLIHGEGDRIPGFVLDRYNEYAVLRCDGDASTRRAPEFIDALVPELDRIGVSNLVLKTGRGREALASVVHGDAPPDRLEVRERGMRLHASLLKGQKTGLFLDHRESRHRVRSLAGGLSVLNLYGYTGGFSVAAGLGGAIEVTTVDIARPALDFADSSWRANDLGAECHRMVAADVSRYLAEETRDRPGLIVSDPPNFAPREDAREEAMSTYTRLHRSCLSRLAPGGLYLAASCSSHIHGPDFDLTLREAAVASGAVVQRLGAWSAPADHPRLDSFPESDYLKVRLLRRIA